MAYCVKCGVELSDSEPKCPLCGTVVYHPDIERKEGEKAYPPFKSNPEETVSRSGVMFILSFVCFLLLALTFLCDLNINGGFTWSGYVMGAVALFYTIIVLPLWFKKPNPVIFVSADFVALELYLLFIDLIIHGGWYMSFAFPAVGCLALIVITVVTLARYVRRGYLYIFGGAIMATGLFAVLIEYLINHTFHIRGTLIWSIYPLVAFFLIGMALIVIAISKPLRESLHRKFFV